MAALELTTWKLTAFKLAALHVKASCAARVRIEIELFACKWLASFVIVGVQVVQ